MNKIIRADFREEGNHQWVLNYKSYRVVIRAIDGDAEVTIKAEITKDPSMQEWDRLLLVVNEFYKNLVIAESRKE